MSQTQRSFQEGAVTAWEAFVSAIEDAEHDDPRNGASSCASWLRAIAYGLAASMDGSGEPVRLGPWRGHKGPEPARVATPVVADEEEGAKT